MTTLGDFGLQRTVIIRSGYTDDGGTTCCPECGADISDTGGTPQIPADAIADTDLLGALFDQGERSIPAHAFVCEHDDYDVVVPKIASRSSAPGLPDGWTGVPVEFADETIRHVPLPARELPFASDGGERDDA